MFVIREENGMAKINAAALAAQYLEEAEILKRRHAEMAAVVHRLRGDDALELRRKMNVFYDMYLECRTTGRYLLRCAQEAAA